MTFIHNENSMMHYAIDEAVMKNVKKISYNPKGKYIIIKKEKGELIVDFDEIDKLFISEENEDGQEDNSKRSS